jgi:hypothetical protein
MNRSDRNSERYVIPIHRNIFWTNQWMQDPKKKFFQDSHHDPSAQYKKSWGSWTRKRGLTLFYNYRRPGHLAKECPGRNPSCLCCKAMDYEVLDFPITLFEPLYIVLPSPKNIIEEESSRSITF